MGDAVEHPNLAAALVAALAELTVVEKGKTAKAGAYTYDYADIAAVVCDTRPVLAKHGVVALTPVHAYGDGLACTVIFLHASGERIDFDPFPFPHGKDAQATGSMVTYHRRYALLAALGMATADDDGEAAKPRDHKDSPRQGQSAAKGRGSAPQPPTAPPAKIDPKVSALVERLNKLPEGDRKKAKDEFVKRFGVPEKFTLTNLEAAEQFVARYENQAA